MIKIPCHIASICRINNLFLINISSIKTKHITTKMKFTFTDISKRLTNDLTNIFDHYCVLWAEMLSE